MLNDANHMILFNPLVIIDYYIIVSQLSKIINGSIVFQKAQTQIMIHLRIPLKI